MAWHILGWLVLASQLGGAAWLGRYLFVVGSRPWTWQRRLPVPKHAPLTLSSGADYVGFV